MRAILAALLASAAISAARADDTTNSADNPLTAETSLNLQNYYTPSLVPSRLVLELTGASSGDMRLSDHAARSMI